MLDLKLQVSVPVAVVDLDQQVVERHTYVASLAPQPVRYAVGEAERHIPGQEADHEVCRDPLLIGRATTAS